MTLANYELLIDWIRPLLAANRAPILEIGCLGGQGTRALALAFPEREIYALDTFDLNAEEAPELRELYRNDLNGRDQVEVFLENIHGLDNITVVISDSRDWEPDVRFALAIIDGVHTYDCVINDLEKAIGAADYVAVHDYNGDLPQVTEAVNEVVRKYGLKLHEIGNTFAVLEYGTNTFT